MWGDTQAEQGREHTLLCDLVLKIPLWPSVGGHTCGAGVLLILFIILVLPHPSAQFNLSRMSEMLNNCPTLARDGGILKRDRKEPQSSQAAPSESPGKTEQVAAQRPAPSTCSLALRQALPVEQVLLQLWHWP